MRGWHKRNDRRVLTGRPWRRLRQQILERDRYQCQPCKARGLVTEAKEVDHVRALAHGGTDVESNLQAICTDCHGLKSLREAHPNARIRGCDVNGLPLDPASTWRPRDFPDP